jgi:hypothetical protein
VGRFRWSSHPLTPAQALSKCRRKENSISTCSMLNPQGERWLKSWAGCIPGRLINFSLGTLGRKTDYWYAYWRATFGGKITG